MLISFSIAGISSKLTLPSSTSLRVSSIVSDAKCKFCIIVASLPILGSKLSVIISIHAFIPDPEFWKSVTRLLSIDGLDKTILPIISSTKVFDS